MKIIVEMNEKEFNDYQAYLEKLINEQFPLDPYIGQEFLKWMWTGTEWIEHTLIG
jgi:hypothetical protein